MIRSCDRADGEALLASFLLTHGESGFLLTYPDECRFTAEEESAFLQRKAASPREAELCAVLGGRIVGTAGIEALGTADKLRHRAELGIAVERACWGRGIGRALAEACIALAREAGYLQLELTYVSENERAGALYRSLGFTEFGRNPFGFRTREGLWQELVLMRLPL